MFTKISIKNFRGFRSLTLEDLQQVNLIVGKNNSGKTSLLEGLAVLADPASLGSLPALLRRTQGGYPQRFYRWLVRDSSESLYAELQDQSRGESYSEVLLSRSPHIDRISQGKEPVFKTDGFKAWRLGRAEKALRWKTISVLPPASPDELVKTFAKAVRQRDGEERLEGLLRKVDPRVKKVRVDIELDREHIIVVDLGLSEMLPLSQAGEGMQRLVEVFSELVGDQPQLCFIDEVENGIHHSVLPQVWTGVAEVAEQLSIQIFATTHSFECLEAAHEAFAKRPKYAFSVIQLFRAEGDVQGRVLDRSSIEAALNGNIDLR